MKYLREKYNRKRMHGREILEVLDEVQPFVIKINELDDLIDALNKIGE